MGKLAFVAGQVAADGDRMLATGRVGAEVDVETATECARQCARNLLGQLQAELGDLGAIRQIGRITVFVASDPGFTGQTAVADGASEVLLDVLGDAGQHARSAVGVICLPRNSPVEVDALVELR